MSSPRGSPPGLACPVCMDPFDEVGRRPLCLHCGHCVCATCAPLLNLCPVPGCRSFAHSSPTPTSQANLSANTSLASSTGSSSANTTGVDLHKFLKPAQQSGAHPPCGDCGAQLAAASAWHCACGPRLLCSDCGLSNHRRHSIQPASQAAQAQKEGLRTFATALAAFLNAQTRLYNQILAAAEDPWAALTQDPLKNAKQQLRDLADACLAAPVAVAAAAASVERKTEEDEETGGERIYIGNLLYTAGPKEISEWLAREANCRVVGVRIPADKNTGRPKGIAFVQMADKGSFRRALALDGSQWGGRTIRVAAAEHPSRAGAADVPVSVLVPPPQPLFPAKA